MAKYRLTESGVKNTETTAFIPEDENNNDWKEYKKWLNEGNKPLKVKSKAKKGGKTKKLKKTKKKKNV